MVTEATIKKIETAEARRLAAEKRRHGYEPGVRFLDGQQYLIEVAWYPKTKWTAKTAVHDGKEWKFGPKFALTPEFWAKLKPLRL